MALPLIPFTALGMLPLQRDRRESSRLLKYFPSCKLRDSCPVPQSCMMSLSVTERLGAGHFEIDALLRQQE